MGDKLEKVPSEEQLERIAEYYVDNSTLEQIAYRSKVPLEMVLKAFDDPEFAAFAIRRKASRAAAFAFGLGVDRMTQIIQSGTDQAAMQAFNTLSRVLEKVSVEKTPEATFKTIEAAMDKLDA